MVVSIHHAKDLWEQKTPPEDSIEHRTPMYDFTSLRAMIRFFYEYLPKDTVDEVVRKARIGFRRRPGCSLTEHRQQFIKKCEWTLSRIARS